MTTETAAFGAPSWLPERIQRAQAIEDQREQREGRAAEAEREGRREVAEDRARMAYRSQAEARGDVVSAVALATGQGLGRTIGDVFTDARAQADIADAREAARQRHEREDGPAMAGRSDGWPESRYQLERMVRQAEDNGRWMVAYQTRLASRQGRGAEHVAAVRDRRDAVVSRSAFPGRESSGELNVYQAPAMGWEAVRAEDARDDVIRRGTEGAIVGLR
jgi:hypothetical protein